MKTRMAGLAAFVMAACSMSRSSQSMGCCFAHCAFAFDQSYDTMPNVLATAAGINSERR